MTRTEEETAPLRTSQDPKAAQDNQLRLDAYKSDDVENTPLGVSGQERLAGWPSRATRAISLNSTRYLYYSCS